MKFKSRGKTDSMSLAGWLFADLLLAIAIVGLGSQALYTPEPTNSESAEAPKVLALDTKPIEIEFSIDGAGVQSGNSAAIRDLRRQVLQNPQVKRSKERIAGLVEVFSGATTSACGGDKNVSTTINNYLRQWLPNLVNKRTLTKDFILASCSNNNRVQIIMYLFV
jgi:hypothetical protein